MALLRKWAGLTLIATSLGLSAISGSLSFDGINQMLPIPGFGFLGVVIAVSLVALSVGFTTTLNERQWTGALAVGALVLVIGAADGNTNTEALLSQVAEAEQDASDRNAGYHSAVADLDRTRTEIDDLEERFELMQADEPEQIEKAQIMLAGLGLYEGRIDGKRGPKTLAAMRGYGAELRQRLSTLRETEAELMPTVARGATVAELPFSVSDAYLYGWSITLASLLISFAGGWLARKDEVHELQEAVDDLAEDFDSATQILNFAAEQMKRRAA